MEVKQLIDQFTRAGQVFTDSLDRSAIGSLATPSDVFALAVATCFADVAKKKAVNDAAAFRSAQYNMHARLAARISPLWCPDSEEALFDAKDEALMWMDTLGETYAHLDHPRRGLVFNITLTHRLRLLALQHPERLSFYEAGIIEVDYIQQCIDNGIEADIARQLTAA